MFYLCDAVFPHVAREYGLIKLQQLNKGGLKSWILAIKKKQEYIYRFDIIFQDLSHFNSMLIVSSFSIRGAYNAR